MVLAALVGGPLGAAAGFVGGNILFRAIYKPQPIDFLTKCDQKADNDPDIEFPKTAGLPVDFVKKLMIKDTSPWLSQPDYDRALFINKILTLLWPHLSPAIHKEVMKQSRAPIQEALANIPLIEDVRIDKLDLGERPFRVDSFKSYQTFEDELIIETPMFWGGDMKVRVTAVVKAGPARIDIPVDVADIQFKALTRITIKPLVETLPCVGGVTLSLLEEPTVNCDFRIGDSADLLSIPGVPLAIKTAIKIVAGKMLIYPNEFSVPLMPNYGLPPPPLGMLHVNVVEANGLASSFFDKADPYVALEVREGRPMQTTTKNNETDPVWNEALDFVLDDPAKQHLKVIVYDNDLVSASVIGGALIDLSNAEFMAEHSGAVAVKCNIYAPDEDGGFPVVTTWTPEAPSSGKKKRKGLLGKLRNKQSKKSTPGASPAATPPKVSPRPAASEIESEAAGSESTPTGAAGSTSTAQGVGATDVATTSTADSAGADAVVSKKKDKKKPPTGAVTGTITLEITFFPFTNTDAPAAAEGDAAVDEKGKPVPREVASVRKILQEVSLRDTMNPEKNKGVLTLYLKKVLNLEKALDTYVQVRLYDPYRLPVPDMIFRTKVEFNEDSPRYNFKTDFVNISAASVLTLTIHAVPGLMESLTSLKIPFLSKKSDKVLGRVRIPLTNVVSEGRVKDVYPLQEAQTGELHCTMDWKNIDFFEDEEEIVEEEEGESVVVEEEVVAVAAEVASSS